MDFYIIIIFLLFLFCINTTIEYFGNQLILPDFTTSIYLGKDIYKNINTNTDNIKYNEGRKPSEVETVKQPDYSKVDFNNLIGEDDNFLKDKEIYDELNNINEELKYIEGLKFESKYMNKAICGKRNMQIVEPPGSTVDNLLTPEERSFIKSINIPETCLWTDGTHSNRIDSEVVESEEGCGYNDNTVCERAMDGRISDDKLKQSCQNKNSAIWRHCKRFCCQNLLFPTDLPDTIMNTEQRIRYGVFTNENTIKPYTKLEITN